MPRLSVWFIRTACAHLALGFTFGGLLLFHKGVPLHPLMWRVLPLHIESVLMGWTLQLALGVAFWVLPRFRQGAPRGDERPAWLAYGLVNAGVLAVMAGSWMPEAAWLVFAGRLAELTASLIFARHAWPRIKVWGGSL